MSTAVAYPSALPGPQPGSFDPRPRRAASSIDGLLQQRARQRDAAGMTSQYTFVYTPAQIAVWRDWWRDDLLNGRRWFAMSLPGAGGMISRVVRYRDIQLQLLGTGIYRVSASIEQRGASLSPKMADPPGVVGFLCQFDTLVAPGAVLSDVGPNVNLSGSAALQSGVVKFGSQALYVPAGSSAITTATINVPLTGRSWRWEFWTHRAADVGRIISLNDSANGRRYFTGLAPSGYVYDLGSDTGGSSGWHPAAGPSAGVWVHVAIEQKYAPGGSNIYVFNSSWPGLPTVFSFGGPYSFLDGSLTQVRIGNGFDNIYVDSARFMSFAPAEDSYLYQVSGYVVPTGPFTVIP